MKRVLFERTYYGFEDAGDLERDMSEVLDPKLNPDAKGISPEFQGRVKVVVTYEED